MQRYGAMNTENLGTVLITGVAGFIGFSLARKLLSMGMEVVGVDNLDPYYDPNLKKARISEIMSFEQFTFYQADITSGMDCTKVFSSHNISIVIHLAAQAGVRYSIENPRAYISANIQGTLEILEACKRHKVSHLLIASTSSVYGGNTQMPFEETQKADTQMSLYAASKKAVECISHSYSHLFRIPVTCFRFFTVYGPWGRPDMALFKFTKAIKAGEPIDVYNNGKMSRDFTYIDDLVEAITRLLEKSPSLSGKRVCASDSLSEIAPWRVVNIGNASPVPLLDYIKNIEICLGKSAIKNFMPMQPGDVPATVADVSLLKTLTDFTPQTLTNVGVANFIKWYNHYYG